MKKNREHTIFGPSGNSVDFYESGHKSSFEMPAYLKNVGLDWYEYQCGKGLNIKDETAIKIGEMAKENGIGMSIHSPYYINLANPEKEKRDNSRNYIIETLQLAKKMNVKRIVVHPGTCRKISRDKAMELIVAEIKILLSEAHNANLSEITICPETMGKKNQIGNLKEILTICELDDRIMPTLDFGHLNSRRQGSIKGEEDYSNILDAVENRLGEYRMKNTHIHFSQIEYSSSGERRHLNFEDKEYGPFFDGLAKQLVKRKMTAIVVCESKDVMIHDALIMKKMYEALL